MHSGRGDQSCSLGLGFGWPSTGIGLPNPGESALLEAGPRWDWMGGQEAAGSTKEPGRVVSQPHAPSYHQPCPPYRTPSPLTCCRPGSQTIRHKTATEEELTPASCLPVFFPGVPSSPAHPGRRQGLLIDQMPLHALRRPLFHREPRAVPESGTQPEKLSRGSDVVRPAGSTASG